MSLYKAGKVHGFSQAKNSPKVTKLPMGRLRVERRFDIQTHETFQHNRFNRDGKEDEFTIKAFGGYGLLDGTDLPELPALPDGTEWSEANKHAAYLDCRLIDEDCDPGQDNKWIVTQIYETLTAKWALHDKDQTSVTERGIDALRRTQIAMRDTPLPLSKADFGHATLDDLGTRVLSGIIDKSTDRYGLVETMWAKPAILSVRVVRVGGQQRVQVTSIGLPSAVVSNALGVVTERHKLIDETIGDWDGFETNDLVYEVEEFTVLAAASSELTVIRKTELSETAFIKGTINDTTVSFEGSDYVLRQEEVDNDGIIKKRVRSFALYEAASFPAQNLYEIDRRYGIAVPVVRQVVPFGEEGSISATSAKQVEPVDAFRSLKFTILAADVPAQQVWYERRNVNIFPTELKSAVIVGSELPTAIVNYTEPPRTGVKVRITRKYSWGAPVETTRGEQRNFRPQPFLEGVEVATSRSSTSVSESSGRSESSGTSNNVSSNSSQSTNASTSQTSSRGTNTSTVNSSNTGASTNATVASNTGQSTTNSNNNFTSNSTSNSNGASSTSSNNTGTSNSTSSSRGTSTNRSGVSSSSSNSGNSSNRTTSNSRGTSNGSSNTTTNNTVNSNGTSSGTSNGTSNTTSDTTSISSGDTTNSSTQTTVASINSALSTSSPTRTSEATGTQESAGTNESETIGNGTSDSTSSSTSNSTTTSNSSSNGTSNSSSNTSGTSNTSTNSSSNNSGNSNSNSNSSGTSSSTSNNTTSSTNTGTSTSSGNSSNTTSGTSSNSGTNSSTGNSTSSTSTNGTSTNQGTSRGTSDGTNNSTTNSTSDNSSNSTSENTGTSDRTSTGNTTTVTQSSGARVVTVSLRPCLRPETVVTINGSTITIPATVPTVLPWGAYTEISRRASHWKYNIWVEEIEDAYLEAL